MKILWRLTGIIGALMMLFVGCAPTTQIMESWKVPGYAGGEVKKTLVVVISKKAGDRNLFENELVALFNDNGGMGLPSAAILPRDAEINRDSVDAAIDSADIDSVFVLKLLELKKEEVYTPPQVTQLPHGYLGSVGHAPMIPEPGYYETHLTVRLESALYETNKGTVIWSAVSETLNPESPEHLLKSYKPVILKELCAKGFVK
jgi:hypothetical protein